MPSPPALRRPQLRLRATHLPRLKPHLAIFYSKQPGRREQTRELTALPLGLAMFLYLMEAPLPDPLPRAKETRCFRLNWTAQPLVKMGQPLQLRSKIALQLHGRHQQEARV
jgi:hypothetical protein